MKFLEDKAIKRKEVGVTCERCAIRNCKVRQAPAIILDRVAKNKKIESIVEELNAKFQK